MKGKAIYETQTRTSTHFPACGPEVPGGHCLPKLSVRKHWSGDWVGTGQLRKHNSCDTVAFPTLKA